MELLILGAGGLGCELLKDIVTMVHSQELDLTRLCIIDMDTIELTNLNRQFMFSDHNIGDFKANVAIKYVRDKYPGLSLDLESLVTDLTTLSMDFFKQFDIIISGLDAIEPRRFINQMVCQIKHHEGKIIPFIDGGVESLKGHIKLIIPGVSSCWECSIQTLPNPQNSTTNVPLCTIATNPRSLEHVIEYVYIKFIQDYRSNDEWDKIPNIVEDLLDQCDKRALKYGISRKQLNISYMLGIMKKIIPNVSTTNAMIAAQCSMEFYKLYHDMIDLESPFHNFILINGGQGHFHYSFTYQRDPKCVVCSHLFE